MNELDTAKSWVMNLLIETLKLALENADTPAEVKAVTTELNRLIRRNG